MELTRNDVSRFTKGINLPGLQKSSMGLPPFLQRKEQGADYLREAPDYVRDKPPGYDPQVNAVQYLSLTERHPTAGKRCGQYACGA